MVWSTNALEGSSYTLGETTAAIIKNLSAAHKPMEEGSMSIDRGRAIEYMRKLVLDRMSVAADSIFITEKQLLKLPTILLKHTFAEDILVGECRRHEIGVNGCPYVFPVPEDVPGLVRAFLQWLNDPARESMNPVILATEAHLRFVTIHPFEDGNGRMSRLIMCLVLMLRRYVPIYIAPECNPEYKRFVKHYQVTKMNPHTNNVGDIEPLLKLVANEVRK